MEIARLGVLKSHRTRHKHGSNGCKTFLDHSFRQKPGVRKYGDHVQYCFKNFLLGEQSSQKESWLEGSSQDMAIRAPHLAHNIYSSHWIVYWVGRRQRSPPLQGKPKYIILGRTPNPQINKAYFF